MAEKFVVLVVSEWSNPDGSSGTQFIQVGRAFPQFDKPGFMVSLAAGVSVSGKLLITPELPPKDAPQRAKRQPAAPTAHKPFPGNDNDIPF